MPPEAALGGIESASHLHGPCAGDGAVDYVARSLSTALSDILPS